MSNIRKALRYNVLQADAEGDSAKLEDPHGRLFDVGKTLVDLSDVVVCGATLDTVRQLYSGTLKKGALKRIEKGYEYPKQTIKISGFEFYVRRMGKNSGYRYALRNNDFGVIVLVGSYYSE
ncbi:MAG: hypothetical protein HQL50_12305, partial [Magnetococcales bacterium]|nr:hypothetical protein [Magnetococcales bacterium]